MKCFKFLTIVLAFLALGISSCKNDDDPTPNNTTSTIIQQGNWRVTLYTKDGSDKTNQFTGYNFTFNSNGTVTAVKSSSSTSGTWSAGSDDSLNKLYLDFGTLSPFEEINEDWHVLDKTSTKIRLEHVSGGNGGTKLLTFERN